MIDIASQENRVLLKENNGRKCFLAIHPRDDGSLELRDIETDVNFVFSRDQLKSLINNGMFSVRDEEEALEHLKRSRRFLMKTQRYRTPKQSKSVVYNTCMVLWKPICPLEHLQNLSHTLK